MREPNRLLSDLLLDWYDANARNLPWRVPPADSCKGVLPDPYRVWLSEVMLQQTTVAAVKAYYHDFTTRWPTVQDLAAAKDADVMAAWAGLGYYARARNLLKCSRYIVEYQKGTFPSDPQTLLGLPGIGPYTAAAICAIAFGRSEVVVDGNIERVMARYFAVQSPLPKAKAQLYAHAKSLTPKLRAGDYAQAVMDLGATICTPKSADCGACPWQPGCQAYALGITTDLPRRLRKPIKPVRRGIAYVAIASDGAVLLERRPDKGLLGGMLGWPGSEWSTDPVDAPPLTADWTTLNAEVTHIFTHFKLLLKIKVAQTPSGANSEVGSFVPKTIFNPTDLPSVMQKVHRTVCDAGFPL